MAKGKRSFTKWMHEMKASDNGFINAYNNDEVTLKRGRPSKEGIYNQIFEAYGEEMANNARDAWEEYINSDDCQKDNDKEVVEKIEEIKIDMNHHDDDINEDDDDNELDYDYDNDDIDEVLSDDLYERISNDI